MDGPSPAVLKRRQAVEAWKIRNREYYLKQKRELASRPEYLAHRRTIYQKKKNELTLLGILPKKLGRPVLYTPEMRLERRREKNRQASARYRANLFSPGYKKDDTTNSPECENTD